MRLLLELLESGLWPLKLGLACPHVKQLNRQVMERSEREREREGERERERKRERERMNDLPGKHQTQSWGCGEV